MKIKLFSLSCLLFSTKALNNDICSKDNTCKSNVLPREVVLQEYRHYIQNYHKNNDTAHKRTLDAYNLRGKK